MITALRDPDGDAGRLRQGHARPHRAPTKPRRRRALAAERAALAEKARIQEFQERFLAILGHDLRNPLASIDMGAGLLRSDRPIRRRSGCWTGCAPARCACRA